MRNLETPRLILSCELMSQPEIEAAHRIYVEEMDEQSLTLADYEKEVLFDVCLSRNGLGNDFGRPSIKLKSAERKIGHCVFLPRLCSASELGALGENVGKQMTGSIEAEIGWAISDRYRIQGFATEAGQRLIDYAFAELHLARVFAFTEVENHASLRVMQKLGMKQAQVGNTSSVAGVIHR
jgi:RimJ/RimL family protein N-acetyltransferase